METKTFKGKAIYNPSGKAGEYSYWACNFYKGCSNGCTYCYCKKGLLKKTMGGDTPTLKKCFKDEAHALEVFEKELKANLTELQKRGLFFSFTTDPMLEETKNLTIAAVHYAIYNNVPVKLLTKCVEWVDFFIGEFENYDCVDNHNAKSLIAVGFTLTGHDELEPNAPTNIERIEAMKKLHDAGFKTWASIETVISLPRSIEMIEQTNEFCDLYKIGLESGKKCHSENLNRFINAVFDVTAGIPAKIYFKDSLLQQAGISRADLPSNCVGRDYNMFNE